MRSMRGTIVSALLVISIALTLGFVAADGSAAAERAALAKINRGQLAKQLNQSVTVEGYFFDGGIPMLVNNLELVQKEDVLSPNDYVALASAPPGVQSGDKVRLSGTVQKPGAGASDAIKNEPVAVKIAEGGVSKISTSVLKAVNIADIATPSAGTVPPPPPGVTKYALLVGCGANYSCNYPRYWNDLRFTYQLLRARGYQPGNIFVLYAYGTPLGPGMPLNGPAVYANLVSKISILAARMKSQDTLFIGLYGQGTTVADTNRDETPPITRDSVFFLWQNFFMTDDMFAAQVNRITSYGKMIIVLNQSYSGGFINELSRPRRVIMASSSPTQTAMSHPSLYFGHMNYWMLSSFFGHQLLGGAPLNADANGNGQVSVLEAYNMARVRVVPQVTNYDDNGWPPGRMGPVPGGGEGALGAATYL